MLTRWNERAPDETAGADFGDERLSKRFALVLGRLGRKASLATPAATGGRCW